MANRLGKREREAGKRARRGIYSHSSMQGWLKLGHKKAVIFLRSQSIAAGGR